MTDSFDLQRFLDAQALSADIGLQRARPVDNAADVFELHVGTAGMEIGDHGDGELAARRPARQSRRIARNDEAIWFDCRGIDRGPHR